LASSCSSSSSSSSSSSHPLHQQREVPVERSDMSVDGSIQCKRTGTVRAMHLKSQVSLGPADCSDAPSDNQLNVLQVLLL
jgi:hypothetical protein